MKIAHTELYTTSDIVCKFEFSTCNAVGLFFLENNNSVKFTSSRGDNSTTNDSVVMKIAHAQLHMYANIMYKFQTSTCKNCRRKALYKIVSTDRWMDRRMDGQTDGQTNRWTAMVIQCITLHFIVGGIKKTFKTF